MNAFQGILRYEFLMQIRRKTLWVGLAAPSFLLILPDLLSTSREQVSDGLALLNFTIILQIFVPIVAGFFLSDRLSRDERLLTSDWVGVSGASKRQYVWGKYLGAVTATLLVALLYWMLAVTLESASGRFSSSVIGYAFVAFCIVVVPSYLFIGAYCIAVPSIMSLRLFQILFTCYWLWAHQQLVPSVGGTPLTPGGEFAIQLFSKWIGTSSIEPYGTTSYGPFGWSFEISPAITVLNIVLLLVLACVVLWAVERYLIYKQERS